MILLNFAFIFMLFCSLTHCIKLLINVLISHFYWKIILSIYYFIFQKAICQLILWFFNHWIINLFCHWNCNILKNHSPNSPGTSLHFISFKIGLLIFESMIFTQTHIGIFGTVIFHIPHPRRRKSWQIKYCHKKCAI